LISFIQEAHQDNFFGFDLRPSSILLNVSPENLSIAFIRGQEILQKYPDVSQLFFDPTFFPPEIQSQVSSGRVRCSVNTK
jgi:hypothetical protein